MKPMTKQQILRYVPKSKLESIHDAWYDDGGYWIMLKDGWEASMNDQGCQTIHEDSIKWLRYQISGIRRVMK